MCLYTCIGASVSVCLHICVSVYRCVCVCVSVCQCVSVSVSMSVCAKSRRAVAPGPRCGGDGPAAHDTGAVGEACGGGQSQDRLHRLGRGACAVLCWLWCGVLCSAVGVFVCMLVCGYVCVCLAGASEAFASYSHSHRTGARARLPVLHSGRVARVGQLQGGGGVRRHTLPRAAAGVRAVAA